MSLINEEWYRNEWCDMNESVTTDGHNCQMHGMMTTKSRGNSTTDIK